MDIIDYIVAHGYGNEQLKWTRPSGETIGVLCSENFIYKVPYKGYFVTINRVYDYFNHQTYSVAVYENEYTSYVEESKYVDNITEILTMLNS